MGGAWNIIKKLMKLHEIQNSPFFVHLRKLSFTVSPNSNLDGISDCSFSSSAIQPAGHQTHQKKPQTSTSAILKWLTQTGHKNWQKYSN
jgi:hypothetical protein